MATRTSSPPGSRSRADILLGRPTRSRSASKHSDHASGVRRSSARKRASGRPRARSAPGAVRSLRLFAALGRGVAAVWLGIAHAVGAVARRIGQHRPRPRARAPPRRRRAVPVRPRRRRRRRGLVAAARRRDGRHPHRRRRLGRQGRLARAADAGLRRLAQPARPRDATARPAARSSAGSRSPSACSASCTSPTATRSRSPATPATCSSAGGAVGYVVSSLLLDLLRTAYVVVPLLAAAGVLRRPGDHRDAGLPGAGPARRAPRPAARPHAGRRGRTCPRTAVRSRRRAAALADDDIDPEMGDPAYDSPVLERPRAEEASQARRARGHPRPTATRPRRSQVAGPDDDTATDLVAPAAHAAARTGSSSSRCPATSPTPCPATRCSSPARRTRPAPRPATRWSAG